MRGHILRHQMMITPMSLSDMTKDDVKALLGLVVCLFAVVTWTTVLYLWK